jgi:hypothetical protein
MPIDIWLEPGTIQHAPSPRRAISLYLLTLSSTGDSIALCDELTSSAASVRARSAKSSDEVGEHTHDAMIQQPIPSEARPPSAHSETQQRNRTSSVLQPTLRNEGQMASDPAPLPAHTIFSSGNTDVEGAIPHGISNSFQQSGQVIAASHNQNPVTSLTQPYHVRFPPGNELATNQTQSTTSPLLRPTSSSMLDSPLQQANDQSHGTLVISHTGRSKYLGPSAASEWLKDAGTFAVNDFDTLTSSKRPTLCMTLPQHRVRAPPASAMQTEQYLTHSTAASRS